MPSPVLLDLKRSHWPGYCEENVWHLCGALPERIEHTHVLVISNARRTLAMWRQRASGSTEQPVIWDYHVVLLGQASGRWWIWDADSTLPSPQPAQHYLEASFRPLPAEHAELRPSFRVVAADLYRRTLSSDRSHMRATDGGWLAPPPPGEGIGNGMNLMRFVDMQTEFVGQVLDLMALRAWLAARPPHVALD